METSAEKIIEKIKRYSTEHKARASGTQNVRSCIYRMAAELFPCADRVAGERFGFHPNAFAASLPLMTVFEVTAELDVWLAYFLRSRALAAVNAVLLLIAFLILLFEFGLYKRPLDPLFPKREGLNLFAERKAEGETKRRIILCAHADAAYEIPLMLKLKPRLFTVIVGTALTGALALPVIGILNALGLFGSGTSLFLCIAETAFLPSFLPFLFFTDWNTVVDGANDDLTGCGIILSVFHELNERNIRFSHTDVCCLITDGEEAGLRGAMAFAEKHREKLKNSIVIVIDTIHDADELRVYHRGMNFTQRNSEEVCVLIQRAGSACGKEIMKTGFYPGANDADAFSRCDVRAAAICAVPHKPSKYYHTRYDTWESLDAKSIEITRKIVMKLLELADE